MLGEYDQENRPLVPPIILLSIFQSNVETNLMMWFDEIPVYLEANPVVLFLLRWRRSKYETWELTFLLAVCFHWNFFHSLCSFHIPNSQISHFNNFHLPSCGIPVENTSEVVQILKLGGLELSTDIALSSLKLLFSVCISVYKKPRIWASTGSFLKLSDFQYLEFLFST